MDDTVEGEHTGDGRCTSHRRLPSIAVPAGWERILREALQRLFLDSPYEQALKTFTGEAQLARISSFALFGAEQAGKIPTHRF